MRERSRIVCIVYKKELINPYKIIVQLSLMLWLVVKTSMDIPSFHLTFF